MGLMNVLKSAGGVISKTGKNIAKGVYRGGESTLRHLNSESPKENPLGYALDRFMTAGKAMGTWEHSKDIFNETTGKLVHKDGHFKLSKFGAGVIFGGAGAAGAVGAQQNYMNNRVGEIDSQRVTATPTLGTGQYTNQLGPEDMGATGDLVFALHNMRHG